MNSKEQMEAYQQRYYSERRGKVYGDYEVVDVWWDEETKTQVWRMRCIHCGNERVTRNGKEYTKKKRLKGVCPVCKKEVR